MKTEKLELKHIVNYLPYGLKVIHTDFEPMEGNFTSEAEIETMSNECVTFKNSFYSPSDYYFGDLEIDIKPILRPLSDLVKEIEIDGKKIIPLLEICPNKYQIHNCKNYGQKIDFIEKITEGGNSADYSIFIDEKIFFKFATYKNTPVGNFHFQNSSIINDWYLFQKLIEWHFDLFQLIKSGLAIDINTLNNEI